MASCRGLTGRGEVRQAFQSDVCGEPGLSGPVVALHKNSSSQIHIVAKLHFCLGLGPSQNPHVCNLRIKSHFN